jgi:predicted permease
VVGGGSAAYSNGIAIGIPLMQTAFGDSGAVFIIVIVSIHLPIMMVGSIILNEWALHADRIEAHAVPRAVAMRKTALTLATHPVLLAIFAGILWRVSGVPVPALAEAVLQPLARSAGPLALFASGMVLMNFGVARQVRPALALSALKLIVMPALVYAAASAIGLPPLGVAVVTLTAACPTGVNVFIMAGQLGTGQALASNTLIISTAAGVVTVALWLALLQSTLG